MTELRKLRERDGHPLREKSAEVDRLRQEVERLAGEVEVLRGVVEEGLRGRRTVRDATVEPSEAQSAADVAMSADLDKESEEGEHPPEEEEPLDDRRSIGEGEESGSDAEPFDPASIMGSSRENVGAPDRTTRTDHATRGSSLNATPAWFIGDEELARIAADVEERRSNLSSGSGSYRERARQQQSRRATVEEVSDAGTEIPQTHGHAPTLTAGPSQPRRPHARPHPARLVVPTPSRQNQQQQQQQQPETPFPQMRGAHLERLFFSAPEHNARTCTVCVRRRGPVAEPREWVPSRMERDFKGCVREAEAEAEDEDEGFVEGEEEEGVAARERKREGRRREPSDGDYGYKAVARKVGLPPQTIVARVIRELEDDFTHYKRSCHPFFSLHFDFLVLTRWLRCLASTASWQTSTRRWTPCQMCGSGTCLRSTSARLSIFWSKRWVSRRIYFYLLMPCRATKLHRCTPA